MKRITLEQITALAYDANTKESYAEYLHKLLLKSRDTVRKFESSLNEINFQIDIETGVIHPFGEISEKFNQPIYTRM